MNTTRRTLIKTASLALLHRHAFAGEGVPLIASIEKTMLPAPPVKGGTWFHPRACMVGKKAFMTLQEIKGSDFFGPVHWTTSDDLGKTWSPFQPAPPLGWVPEADGHEGVCDVTPEFHPQTGSVLALGHNVFYKAAHFDKNQPPRWPVYHDPCGGQSRLRRRERRWIALRTKAGVDLGRWRTAHDVHDAAALAHAF
jgi:hypothetical protein